MKNTKRAIIVLGMHRSGTSAITRVLSLSGAQLPRTLLPPIKNNNETGFWESEDLYVLHEELFKVLGIAWNSFAVLPKRWMSIKPIRGYVDRAVAILNKDFSEAPLFVIKDPRISLIVPFWVEVLSKYKAEPVFVIALRNPLQVAESLLARDQIPLENGALLWLKYMVSAEHGTRGYKRCVATYESLLQNWQSVVNRLGQSLKLPLEEAAIRHRIEIERFLTPSLQHFNNSQTLLDKTDSIPDLVKKSYAEWINFGQRGHLWRPNNFKRIRREYLQYEDALLHLEAYRKQPSGITPEHSQ